MRIDFFRRFLRFLFVPVCMLSSVMLLHNNKVYQEIDDYCNRRQECFASCIRDNFPKLACDHVVVEVEYHGNVYSEFFYYPKAKELDSGEY